MQTRYSFKLERTADNDVLRGFVFKTLTNKTGLEINEVHDIAEGSLEFIETWITEEYPYVTTLHNGDTGDALSLFEAAVLDLESRY